MNKAHVRENRIVNPLTGETYINSYEWVGEPYWPVALPRYFDVNRLPWPMECIETHLLYSVNVWIRTDAGFWYAYHRFHSDWCKLLDLCYSVRSKLVLTASVWGLAEAPDEATMHQFIDWSYLRWGRMAIALAVLSAIAILLH